MTEREQALFDIGKAAFLDSRLDLYDKELAQDDVLREIVRNSIERVNNEGWNAFKDVADGKGTDGEREALHNGFLAGQLLWDTNFKADEKEHVEIPMPGGAAADPCETCEIGKFADDATIEVCEQCEAQGKQTAFHRDCENCPDNNNGNYTENNCRVRHCGMCSYDEETPSTKPVDGQEAAASNPATDDEKRRTSGFAAVRTDNNRQEKTNMKTIELFNVQEGASDYIPQKERETHPNAEYFTAERNPYEHEKEDGVKRVTLTFRRLVTVKDGEIVDATKSGEFADFVAVKRDEKIVLVGDATLFLEDEILGVLVRRVLHFDM